METWQILMQPKVHECAIQTALVCARRSSPQTVCFVVEATVGDAWSTCLSIVGQSSALGCVTWKGARPPAFSCEFPSHDHIWILAPLKALFPWHAQFRLALPCLINAFTTFTTLALFFQFGW